jgi:hypothetical protein
MLSSLHGGFPFRDDRNRGDASGATAQSLRPDYSAYCSGGLIAKAEHKATPLEQQVALRELLAKMNGGWNPLVMRGMPLAEQLSESWAESSCSSQSFFRLRAGLQ